MNESQQPRSPRADETTLLHLHKFAHGTPVPPAVPASGEPATTLIRRAAAEVISETTRPVVVPSSAAPLSPDEMLGAVAYCYVKGVFSSADIERKMLRDPEFREALNGVVPDPDSIRRFRRLNREAIQIVLEKFYARIHHQQKAAIGGMVNSSETRVRSPGNGAAPEENTALFTRRAASERLDKATFIDGMSDF